MAKIPLGNFAQPMQAPQPTQGMAPGGQDFVGAAVEQLGQTAQQGINHVIAVNRQNAELQKRQDEAVNQAKAANKQLDYEVQVKSTAMAVKGQIATGAIAYQDAPQAYTDAVNKIQAPAPDGLEPAHAINFSTNLSRIRAEGSLGVQQSSMVAQEQDNRGQFGQALDSLGKLAGMPDADVASINARADAAATLGRNGGLSSAQVAKDLQDFKDNNWTQQATQRSMFARNDVGALDTLAQDLTAKDGFYADKLDSNKRNAILSQVINRKQMLMDRADHQQDRADAVGARTISQIDAQIGSGVPATPEMFAQWADATKGTASAGDFAERVQDYDTVQQVLRMPEDKQQSYLQAANATLMTKGGTVHDKQILDRITSAVTSSIKQRNTDPLLWNQSRLGDAVAPLDVATLPQQAVSGELGKQLQQRAATIDAMRGQYGNSVPMKLLLPQEADAVSSMLSSAIPKQQAALFGMIQKSVNDDKVYSAIMQQIAPANPVLAYAGKIMGTGAPAITDVKTHWFSPNANVTMAPTDIAQTMLDGQALIKPDEKGATKFPMPSDGGTSGLRSQWTNIVGDGFRGDGASDAQAYQAYRAMYAGLAAKAGKSDGTIDDDLAATAAKATIGNIGDWNGKNVIPPYGMDFNKFKDAANASWATERASVPAGEREDLDNYNLDRIGDGVYAVSNGQSPVRDVHGQPVVIRVSPSGPVEPDKPKEAKPSKIGKLMDAVGYGVSHIPLVSRGNDGS